MQTGTTTETSPGCSGTRAGLYAGLISAGIVGSALYVRKASIDQLFVFRLSLAPYGLV